MDYTVRKGPVASMLLLYLGIECPSLPHFRYDHSNKYAVYTYLLTGILYTNAHSAFRQLSWHYTFLVV